MTLPKAYMKVIRNITGYWGTYLPSERLIPGMVGRVENGLFVEDDPLEKYSGFDRTIHGAAKPEPSRSPVSVWQSKDVVVTSTQGKADVTGAPVKGSIRLGFSKANDAVMICKGIRSQGFKSLGAVRSLLYELYESGAWDKDLCLITEVVLVNAAWICFATNSNQQAEINASATVGIAEPALAALKLAAAEGSLTTSWSSDRSTGYSTEVTEGGTPLFHAIQFKRSLAGLGPTKLQFLRGGSSNFEEPAFGQDSNAA
ncbi:MAG: hypothetical protein WB608_13075 [Terracidiphilus sp.]